MKTGRQQDAPLWIWGAGRLLRKGGREEGREGLHESSHVRVLRGNGGRCPASLPGSPPPHVQEAAPRAHGVEGMRWTAASQSARGGLFRAIISGLTRLATHCADWADAQGLPPLRGLRPPLRWGGEGERPGTAVKGGGGREAGHLRGVRRSP